MLNNAFKVVEFYSINQVVANPPSANVQQETVYQSNKSAYELLEADNAAHFKIATQFRKGKFIQVLIKQEAYRELMLAADRQYTTMEIIALMPFTEHNFWYHAAILKELLIRLNLSGGYAAPFQHRENHEYCHFDSQQLDVIGGGYYELDPDCFSLQLSSKSTAYGRYDAGRIIKQFDQFTHRFSDYQLFTK